MLCDYETPHKADNPRYNGMHKGLQKALTGKCLREASAQQPIWMPPKCMLVS